MGVTAQAMVIVQGLVQGVGFRYFVHREASRLALTGYAENLMSGDVKIVVEGERGMIEELLKTVRRGPRSSHVSKVTVDWQNPEHRFSGFEIR